MLGYREDCPELRWGREGSSDSIYWIIEFHVSSKLISLPLCQMENFVSLIESILSAFYFVLDYATMESSCPNVTCSSKSHMSHCKPIVPPGACCPICGKHFLFLRAAECPLNSNN